MSEEKKLEIDTVKLLRAVMKISSALNEFDSIVFESKYFKYRFKVIATKWCKSMLMHTDNLMKSLMEEDDKLLIEVYSSIDESTKDVNAGTPEKTSLVIFYAKLKSAMWDIEQMEHNRNTFYPEYIYRYTNKILKEMDRQFKHILDTKDSEEKGVDHVVNYLNELGSIIMHYGGKEA